MSGCRSTRPKLDSAAEVRELPAERLREPLGDGLRGALVLPLAVGEVERGVVLAHELGREASLAHRVLGLQVAPEAERQPVAARRAGVRLEVSLVALVRLGAVVRLDREVPEP